MFEACYVGLNEELSSDDCSIIEACLQAITSNRKVYLGILSSLSNGSGEGFEICCILLSSDVELDDCFPSFDGVCFEYDNEYASTDLETGEIILQKSMEIINLASEFPNEVFQFNKQGVLVKNK